MIHLLPEPLPDWKSQRPHQLAEPVAPDLGLDGLELVPGDAVGPSVGARRPGGPVHGDPVGVLAGEDLNQEGSGRPDLDRGRPAGGEGLPLELRAASEPAAEVGDGAGGVHG